MVDDGDGDRVGVGGGDGDVGGDLTAGGGGDELLTVCATDSNF